MKPNYPANLMWARACEMLDRAESLHAPRRTRGGLAWEPPVDVFEGGSEVFVRIAVPDLRRDDFEIRLEANALSLSGTRRRPAAPPGRSVRRLEIPFGRIERRVVLPSGRYRLTAEQYRDGCLEIHLERTPGDE